MNIKFLEKNITIKKIHFFIFLVKTNLNFKDCYTLLIYLKLLEVYTLKLYTAYASNYDRTHYNNKLNYNFFYLQTPY